MTTRTRKPKTRSMKYDALVGTLALTVDGKEAGSYWLDSRRVANGVVVRLTKFVACRTANDAAHYDVLIGSKGERRCSCRGFCKWKHCKHVDSVAALVAAGKLS